MTRALRKNTLLILGSALVLILLTRVGVAQAQPEDTPLGDPPAEAQPQPEPLTPPAEKDPPEEEPPPPPPMEPAAGTVVDQEEPPASPIVPPRPAVQPAESDEDPEPPADELNMNGVFLGATLLIPFKNQSEMGISASTSSSGTLDISMSLPTYPVRLLVGYRAGRWVPYVILSLDHHTVSNEVQVRESKDSYLNYDYEISATSLMGGVGTRVHVIKPAPGGVSVFLVGEFIFIVGFGSSSHSDDDDLSAQAKKIAEEMEARFWSQFKWIGFRAGVGGEYHVARNFGIGVSGGLLYIYNWDKQDYKEMEVGSSTVRFYGYNDEHHVLNFFASVDLNIYF